MRIIAALIVLLLAAVARAQTFESSSNAGFRSFSVAAKRARLDIARRKKEELPAPPSKVTIGGPLDKHRKDELKVFQNGWHEAMKLLKEEKSCQKFFADHGDDYDKVIAALQATDYHFMGLPEGIGAETLDGKTVWINSNGLFMSAQSGEVTLNRKRYDLESPSRVRAMILMHELGHELGIFGADAAAELQAENAAHSLDIIGNCLKGNGDDKPKS